MRPRRSNRYILVWLLAYALAAIVTAILMWELAHLHQLNVLPGSMK